MLSIQDDLLIEMRVRAVRDKTNLSALTERLYEKYLKKIEKKNR
jgi:hypothetical protein